mgnify:CR=1 FL=1
MKLLIRQATIIDPASPHHGQQRDILIDDERIVRIGEALPADGAEIITYEGLHLSPGWVDMGVQIGDPGFEHREDIESVTAAAAAGGFTSLGVYPNTEPAIHAKPEVNYLIKQSRLNLVDILPIGAVTRDCAGKEITEMIDMSRVGAVAFSDGAHPIQNNGMMMRALQYVKAFNGMVINRPHDASIAAGGQVHEGAISTMLGMKGIPNMAEEMMVQRDIYLAEYTDSRVHIAGVSSAQSVALIRQAKAKGVAVTCSVPALNLVFTEEEVRHFDVQFKVLPPLRSVADRDGLREGVRDGTIDVIFSNHVPLEQEQKKLEFAYAGFGAIGLETTYGLLNTHLRELLSAEMLVEKMAIQPRAVFDLAPISVVEGGMAELTLFLPEQEWRVDRQALLSKSANTPLHGHQLRGRAVGVIHNGQSFFSQHT